MTKKALVVLSGGQDSTTCLFWAIHHFGKENVHAITFDYGQRHDIELSAAVKVAEMAGLGGDPELHEMINVQGCLVSSSPLISTNELDKYESFEQMEAQVGTNVEKTFVPMRNALFMTIAMNRAVALGCEVIVLGICEADNANYPDCTENFRHRMQTALNASLGYETTDSQAIAIMAPLMHLSKAETVKLAVVLPGCMEALAYSHTSYDGKYPPTDPNHANILRAKGFEVAGVPDPLVVRAWKEGLMALPMTANYDVLREVPSDGNQEGEEDQDQA